MDTTFHGALAAPSTSVLQHPLNADQGDQGQSLDKAALAKVAEALRHGDAETRALAEALVWTLIEDTVVADVNGYLAEFMRDLRQAVRSFEEALD